MRGVLGFLLLAALGCGGDDAPPPPVDASTPTCASDEDCDDGLYCTGQESCDSERGVCAPGSPPCDTSETCHEDTTECTLDCIPDADGDGVNARDCGGSDCDDEDGERFPGNPEICETENHDEDCDPVTFGYRDLDGDGRPDDRCCNVDTGGTMYCGTDCDDAASAVSPDVIEVCNFIDDDCDTFTDEGVTATLYRDSDGDMFGDAAMDMVGCPGLMPGWVTDPTDCNDDEVTVHPGATELCNDREDDCVAPTDPLTCTCTAGETTVCGYSAAPATRCDPIMATCDAFGSFPCPTMGIIRGSEPEVCNSIDDNCNDVVDEGATVRCFIDSDGDRYPPMGATLGDVCPGAPGMCPTGFVAVPAGAGSDCNDGSSAHYPGAVETCDLADGDCDGRIDEGLHVRRHRMAWGEAAAQDAGCGAYAASDCTVAIHNYCSSGRTATGSCPARSGWGIAVHSSAYIEFYCTDVSPIMVTFGELDDHMPSCNDASPTNPFCPTAAHRECRERGYEGGVGPLQKIGGAPTFILCLGTAHAVLTSTTQANLTSIETGCTGYADKLFCQAAINRYCEGLGYRGGYGPLEEGGGNVAFLCMRDF